MHVMAGDRPGPRVVPRRCQLLRWERGEPDASACLGEAALRLVSDSGRMRGGLRVLVAGCVRVKGGGMEGEGSHRRWQHH